jgi:hypothetical protein
LYTTNVTTMNCEISHLRVDLETALNKNKSGLYVMVYKISLNFHYLNFIEHAVDIEGMTCKNGTKLLGC